MLSEAGLRVQTSRHIALPVEVDRFRSRGSGWGLVGFRVSRYCIPAQSVVLPFRRLCLLGPKLEPGRFFRPDDLSGMPSVAT